MVGIKFLEFRDNARTADWHKIDPSVVTNKTQKIRILSAERYRGTIKVKFKDTRINE